MNEECGRTAELKRGDAVHQGLNRQDARTERTLRDLAPWRFEFTANVFTDTKYLSLGFLTKLRL